MVPALLLVCLLFQDCSDEIRALVESLGSDRIEERDGADARLLTFGTAALPLLQKTSHDSDPEIAGRARVLVMQILLRRLCIHRWGST